MVSSDTFGNFIHKLNPTIEVPTLAVFKVHYKMQKLKTFTL